MDHGMVDRGAEPVVAAATESPTALAPAADEAANLSALWTELIRGSCKVEETLFSSQTCTMVVRRSPLPAHDGSRGLSARDIEILEQSLLAGVRKSVAVDFCLCPSSIAEILRHCFRFMGLSCWPSRIPLMLVMAAYAKHTEASPMPAKRVLAHNHGLAVQRVSASRPDLELLRTLSAAEYGVISLLVEGKSYAEIAELRRTSPRTVANQVASAFHRLGISGRAELLCLLAKRQVLHWQANCPGPVSGRPSLATDQAAAGLARAAG